MKEMIITIILTSLFNVSFADDDYTAVSTEDSDNYSKSSEDKNQDNENAVAVATKQAIKEGSGKESDSSELFKSENYRSISSEGVKNEN